MTGASSRIVMRPAAGITLAAGLVLAGLPAYLSYETRTVLGRWSPTYAGMMAAGWVAWLALLGWAIWRARRRPLAAPDPAGRLFGWGCAAMGLGYCITAWRIPSQAARILELNVIGSRDALGSPLEWAGAAAVTVAVLMYAWSRARGRARDAVVLVASVALLVTALEGAARFKALVFPETYGFPAYSETIWRDRFIKTNEMGFRDVDHALSAGDTLRVAVIGDSYAQGWGIRDVHDRFGEQLAARLQTLTGRAWQPLSAGRGDTHTLDHIEYVDSMAKLGPERIVLLYVFNDMDYLHPVTRRSILAPSGGLVSRLHPARVAYANSYLFQEAFVRLRQLSFGMGGAPAATDIYADSALVERHLRDLTSFVEKSRATGAEVVVVPFDIAVVASPQLRARYGTFLDRLRTKNIPTCSLAGAFDGLEFTALVVNRLDSHPNELAHRLAAEAAAPCVAAGL